MSQPLASGIMLVNGREKMARRAAASFQAQSYGNKLLFVLDTGETPAYLPGILKAYMPAWKDRSIGSLRNEAIALAGAVGIICHWDSDDWSHPDRIAEQVALLQASGADAVGYSDLLFWDTRHQGEAWLYTRPSRFSVPGTSLCYWRRTWQEKYFPDLPIPGKPQSISEDTPWQSGLRIAAASSITPAAEPRMIAQLHGSNTQAYIGMGVTPEWKRVPEWDKFCKEKMAL